MPSSHRTLSSSIRTMAKFAAVLLICLALAGAGEWECLGGGLFEVPATNSRLVRLERRPEALNWQCVWRGSVFPGSFGAVSQHRPTATPAAHFHPTAAQAGGKGGWYKPKPKVPQTVAELRECGAAGWEVLGWSVPPEPGCWQPLYWQLVWYARRLHSHACSSLPFPSIVSNPNPPCAVEVVKNQGFSILNAAVAG